MLISAVNVDIILRVLYLSIMKSLFDPLLPDLEYPPTFTRSLSALWAKNWEGLNRTLPVLRGCPRPTSLYPIFPSYTITLVLLLSLFLPSLFLLEYSLSPLYSPVSHPAWIALLILSGWGSLSSTCPPSHLPSSSSFPSAWDGAASPLEGVGQGRKELGLPGTQLWRTELSLPF